MATLHAHRARFLFAIATVVCSLVLGCTATFAYALEPDSASPSAASATTEPGAVYCIVSGERVTGWVFQDGVWRYFDPELNGALQTGFVTYPSGHATVYLDPDGTPRSGLSQIDGTWYYFDPGTYELVCDQLISIEGDFVAFGEQVPYKNCYFTINGAMAYGELEVDGNWYYLEPETGVRAESRFVEIDGQTKYYDEYGVRVSGELWIDGTYCRFDDETGAQIFAEDLIAEATDSEMCAIAQDYSSYTGYLILVDTQRHLVSIYEGAYGSWREERCVPCGNGAYWTPTVRGVFGLGYKGYYFDSEQYRCFYFSQIYGDYYLHSVLYAQTETPEVILDGRLGEAVSHGCVRLDIEDAYFIYSQIPSGTTVVIY